MFKHKSLYKQGVNKNEALLFPPSIDEYVSEDSLPRAIDVYVDSLDMVSLGFKDTRKSSKSDGNKAYHPKLLLKILLYGYLNDIKIPRKLERECTRNIELMFLTRGLYPKYHTISDFKKDNFKALKEIFKEFVLLCKSISLLDSDLFAVDGTFLKANASKNTLLVKSTVRKNISKLEEKIDEYLKVLEFKKSETSELKLDKFPSDLHRLSQKRQDLKNKLEFLKKNDLTQYNKTDPDARLMIKPSQNLMAYNSQIVVQVHISS